MKKYLLAIIVLITSSCASDTDVSPDTVGTGGSLARLTISGDYLYAVDNSRLLSFSLADPMNPQQTNVHQIGRGVETIFAMDTIVFIGTQTGMQMFDISEPSMPSYLSKFEHAVSCDPVVAQDTLAFVTLRSGNLCRTGDDQLDVIDIRNLQSPELIKSYPLENPHGLGIRGNTLFVCEGEYGLKVFEVQKNAVLNLVRSYPEIRCHDVIVKDQILIVVSSDGFYQYDYSDPENLELLSDVKLVP